MFRPTSFLFVCTVSTFSVVAKRMKNDTQQETPQKRLSNPFEKEAVNDSPKSPEALTRDDLMRLTVCDKPIKEGLVKIKPEKPNITPYVRIVKKKGMCLEVGVKGSF